MKYIENGDYIFLYRKILNSDEWSLLSDSGIRVLITIMLGCNWKESIVIVNGEKLTIHPGQWLVSERRLAEIAGVGRQVVRTTISKLEKTEFLTQELTHDKKRIITINKWNLHQITSELTQELTNEQPTSNPSLTHEQPYPKKGNKGKNGKNKEEDILFDVIDIELANLLKKLILENKHNRKVPDNIDTWANDIRKLRELDKRTPEQIRSVIEWSQQDNFWWKNILSASKLRKQFDRLEDGMSDKGIKEKDSLKNQDDGDDVNYEAYDKIARKEYLEYLKQQKEAEKAAKENGE